MASFEDYLIKNNFSLQTQKGYKATINMFLMNEPEARSYTYRDILRYFEGFIKSSIGINRKKAILTAIKKYYDYLIEEGIREDHPCKTFNLKGNSRKGLIFSDLFSLSELETLIEREERYAHLKLKNQVIISLLIYQALLPSEIIALKLSHIDLDAGTIYIRGGRELISRRLEMHPKQYRLFDKYIYEARKRLLYKGESDYLILNFHGKNDTVDGTLYLVETLKPRFPDRNLTTTTIRDSVIAYWLNERKIPLEQVQLIAGHRWISSTLRYRQTPTNEQRETLNKFHPLG